MRDLGAFADDSFDLVFNPVSNVSCPDLPPVWRECFRVLRPAGLLAEAPHQADATARYMPGYFATRAVKPTAPHSP
jgi:ubiquinone/menaquinone biosynthesis C-methylase UbiE